MCVRRLLIAALLFFFMEPISSCFPHSRAVPSHCPAHYEGAVRGRQAQGGGAQKPPGEGGPAGGGGGPEDHQRWGRCPTPGEDHDRGGGSHHRYCCWAAPAVNKSSSVVVFLITSLSHITFSRGSGWWNLMYRFIGLIDSIKFPKRIKHVKTFHKIMPSRLFECSNVQHCGVKTLHTFWITAFHFSHPTVWTIKLASISDMQVFWQRFEHVGIISNLTPGKCLIGQLFSRAIAVATLFKVSMAAWKCCPVCVLEKHVNWGPRLLLVSMVQHSYSVGNKPILGA